MHAHVHNSGRRKAPPPLRCPCRDMARPQEKKTVRIVTADLNQEEEAHVVVGSPFCHGGYFFWLEQHGTDKVATYHRAPCRSRTAAKTAGRRWFGSVRYSTGKQPDGFSRSSQQLRYLRARVVPRREDLRPPPAQATPPAALEAGVSRKWEPAVTAVSYGLHVHASSACPPAGFIYLFIYYGTIPWPPGTRTHRNFRWEAFRRCSVRCARFQFQWPRTTCTTCLGWIGGRASNQSAGRDF
jgi:hypothetical protein